LRLEDVEVEPALQALLYPAGFNYYFSDNVVVVKPVAIDAVGELSSQLVTLYHQDPISVRDALEARTSTKGAIAILDQTQGTTEFSPSQILITDFPAVLEQLVTLAHELDQEPRMISIAIKIIETKLDDASNLGFSWPAELSASLGAANGEGSDIGDVQLVGSGATGTYNPNNGSYVWGTLTVNQLNGVLNLLLQNGRSKLLSDPHITTLDGHQAEIRVEKIIPIPTVSRFTEAASTSDIMTFQDEEVGLSVLVTPKMSGNNKITLHVDTRIEDIIGFAGPVDNQKPITSMRSIKTVVQVANGETVALGGLYKEDYIESTKKFPLLGSIPILGKLLFTSTSKDKTTTDLMILITPTVLPN
jgi:general secretion pathway protein D